MTLRARLKTKWPHIAIYLLLFVAGCLAFVYRSPAVEQRLSPWALYIWSSFFVLGGASSTYGMLRGNWGGEALGLPLLWAASTVYGAALTLRGFVGPGENNGPAIVTGLIITSLAVYLLGRWCEAIQMLRISREH